MKSKNPRILPIFYVLVYAAGFWFIDSVIQQTHFSFAYQTEVSLVILIVAILIVLIGGWQFRLANTTVNPLIPDQTSSLVTDGIYKYSRNPMYVGFALLLLAWLCYLGNVVLLLFMPVFIWHITQVQIIPEEKLLLEKFSQEFNQYMQRTRRWL